MPFFFISNYCYFLELLKSGVDGNLLKRLIYHTFIQPGHSDMLSQIGLTLPILIIAFPYPPTQSLLLHVPQENRKEVQVALILLANSEFLFPIQIITFFSSSCKETIYSVFSDLILSSIRWNEKKNVFITFCPSFILSNSLSGLSDRQPIYLQ